MAPRASSSTRVSTSWAKAWTCKRCNWLHPGEHLACNWGQANAHAKPSSGQRRCPAASQSVNALPSPRTSPSTWAGWQAPRGRQVQAKSRPPPPQSQRTSTRNSWVSFDDEEDEEACADAATPAVPAPAAAVEAAFEGPTPAEDRARRRELAQAAKTAILGVSGGDKYDEAAACLIDKLDTEIRQIDHDSHAAKPARDQLKAVKLRLSRAEVKRDKAEAAVVSAASDYEAAKAKHLQAEEWAREARRIYDDAAADHEKVASRVEADEEEHVAGGGISFAAKVDVNAHAWSADELTQAIKQAEESHLALVAIAQNRRACALATLDTHFIGTPERKKQSRPRSASPGQVDMDVVSVMESPRAQPRPSLCEGAASPQPCFAASECTQGRWKAHRCGDAL